MKMKDELFGVAAALVRNGMESEAVEQVVWQIPLNARRGQEAYAVVEEIFEGLTAAVKKIHRPTYIELNSKARFNSSTRTYEIPVKAYNAALLNLAGK